MSTETTETRECSCGAAPAPVRYRVTVPYMTLRVSGGLHPNSRGRTSMWTVMGYYKDGWVPEGSHPEDVQRHLAEGRLEPVDG
jgi:hypothetical protein